MVRGLSQVNVRPCRTCHGTRKGRCFFHHPQTPSLLVASKVICASICQGQPVGEAAGSLWTQANWGKRVPRGLQELGWRQHSLE